MFRPSLKPTTENGAVFSDDRVRRYKLWRIWDNSKPLVMFIGLNPSTATETENDPTVSRCIRYTHDWGYGGLIMMNLFARRATDPRVLYHDWDIMDAIDDNAAHLWEAAHWAGIVVAAWGNVPQAQYKWRESNLLEMMEDGIEFHALKMNGSGHPSHPLYLRADLMPFRFSPKISGLTQQDITNAAAGKRTIGENSE